MKNKKFAFVMILGLLLPIVFLVTQKLTASIVVSASGKADFILEKSFQDTQVVLLSQDLAKTIIEASGDEIIESKFDNVHIIIEGLKPLICRGVIEKTIVVKIKAEDLDEQIVVLKQKTVIGDNEIISTTTLVEPSENIKHLISVIKFSRNDANTTAVFIEKGLSVKHQSNSNIVKRIVQSKLNESILESMKLTEEIIKRLEQQEPIAIFK